MKIHEGKNVRRIREILDLKQDALADLLGEDWNQQKVSLMEAKEVIDPTLLAKISKALDVKLEAIRRFTNQGAISFINSYGEDNIDHKLIPTCKICGCAFNPFEKLVEVLQLENMKKNELIEKLLQELNLSKQ